MFFLDLRHQSNKNMDIGQGYMDLFMLGELRYHSEDCGDMIVDNNIHFYDLKDQSQWVIGESAASCILSKVAQSEIGKFYVTEEKFNKMFRVEGYKLNTTSIGQHIKIFEEKIGSDKPLKASIEFKDIKVSFGKFDVDAIFDYTMCFSIKMDLLGARELMYDCIVMTTAANIKADNDIMHINLIEHKVNLNTDGANRDSPKRNSMEMTVNEYREFLEDFSFTVSEFKKWMNDVVLRGDRVNFPYTMGEFNTSVKFEDMKMHLLFGVEDDAYKYLEQRFWRDGDD